MRSIEQFLKNRPTEHDRMAPSPIKDGNGDGGSPLPEPLNQAIDGSDQDVRLIHRPNEHTVNRAVDYDCKALLDGAYLPGLRVVIEGYGCRV